MPAAAAPKEPPLLCMYALYCCPAANQPLTRDGHPFVRLDAGEDCFAFGLAESSRLSELESLIHQPLRLFDESRALRSLPRDHPILDRY